METFAQKFEQYLARDRVAKELVRKVAEKKGWKREILIGMLADVSDPTSDKRLKALSARLGAQILSKRSRAALTSRLRGMGKRLQETFEHPFLRINPKSEEFIELGMALQVKAQRLEKFALPKVGKMLSYKAYTGHLPRMFLCVVLDAPRSVSFTDIEKLLWIARDARGLNPKEGEGNRSLEREYKRFTGKPQGQMVLAFIRQARYRRMAQLMEDC